MAENKNSTRTSLVFSEEREEKEKTQNTSGEAFKGLQLFGKHYAQEMGLDSAQVSAAMVDIHSLDNEYKKIIDNAFSGAMAGAVSTAIRQGVTKVLSRTLAGKVASELVFQVAVTGVNVGMESWQKKCGLESTSFSSEDAKTIENLTACNAGVIATAQNLAIKYNFSASGKAALSIVANSAASMMREVAAQNHPKKDTAQAKTEQVELSLSDKGVTVLGVSTIKTAAALPLAVSAKLSPALAALSIGGNMVSAKVSCSAIKGKKSEKSKAKARKF